MLHVLPYDKGYNGYIMRLLCRFWIWWFAFGDMSAVSGLSGRKYPQSRT